MFLISLISVQNEIKERQDFLKEMEALGQGDKYRSIIATEISQVPCCKLFKMFNIVPQENDQHYHNLALFSYLSAN